MENIGFGSIEFYQSQRLFSLALINIFNQMGPDYTKRVLKETFAESTFVLFPKVLTEENIKSTIMNFKAKEIGFK